MKLGFMLLEVLLAITISALLSFALFFSVNQITQSSRTIDDVISVHARINLMMQQLERDISGAMIAGPTIKKNFFATVKDDTFELLTFITNNPLQQMLQSGTSAVKIARIVYRLIPDKSISKKMAKQYILTRQESADLTLDLLAQDKDKQEHTSRAYEMVDGIASLTFSFRPHKDEKQKQQTPEKEKNEKTWDSDSKIDGKDRTAKQVLPELVECEVQFIDSKQAKHKVTLQIIPIIPDMSLPKPASDVVQTSTVQSGGA